MKDQATGQRFPGMNLFGVSHLRLLPWACLLGISVFSSIPAAAEEGQTPTVRGDILDRNGVILATSKTDAEGKTVRHYPLGAMAAHVLGFVTPSGGGKSGIEKSQDELLSSGENKNVRLTLDAGLQYLTEQAFRESRAGRAAAVIIDPSNGEILSMVSHPSFDPNIFANGISSADFEALRSNPANPLFNRAVTRHTPASTFKVAMGIAGAGAGHGDHHLECVGSVTYGKVSMKCWIASNGGQHGKIDLAQSLETSCNCYFYRLGNLIGGEAIRRTCRHLGIGEPPTVELAEAATGHVPGPDDRQWNGTEQEIAILSIGHGALTATPVEMGNVAAAVCNGGKVWIPHLVRQGGKDPALRTDLTRNGLTPEGLEILRDGMRRAVDGKNATASKAASRHARIYGKTGTAANFREGKKNDFHCWFIGYVSEGDAQFAVAVFVEGGSGGGKVAAPIAKRILESCLAVANGFKVDPQLMKPATGHLDPVDEVLFSAPSDAQDYLEKKR